jgi:hypothetical protein
MCDAAARGNVWEACFEHLRQPLTSARELAEAARWAFRALPYGQLVMFMEAHPRLFTAETVLRFYGSDGQGGIYNLCAHQYGDELVAVQAAAAKKSARAPDEPAQLRVAYVGCGVQLLTLRDGVIVTYFDVNAYGRLDVIVQSLDGDVPLGGGPFDVVLVAQASGTLPRATTAARMLVDALAVGGMLAFAFVENSATAITDKTAAAVAEAVRLKKGAPADFSGLHREHPALSLLASGLYLCGFVRGDSGVPTEWPPVASRMMQMMVSRGRDLAQVPPLAVAMSADSHRSASLFTYFVTQTSVVSASAAAATAASRLLYAGSGGDKRLMDANHPTRRDADAFSTGRYVWPGFNALADMPRQLLLATLGDEPTYDGTPSPAVLAPGALRSDTRRSCRRRRAPRDICARSDRAVDVEGGGAARRTACGFRAA